MKKIYTLFSAAILAGTAFAQTIPNAGFETWINNNESLHTYLIPQGWITSDVIQTVLSNSFGDSAYVINSVSQDANAHGGSFACKMSVGASNSGDTTGGIIYSAASFADLMPLLYGDGMAGFTISSRPANLTGYYKLNGNGSEYGVCAMLLSKWNTTTNQRDTLYYSENNYLSVDASGWTAFSFPITYAYPENPDSCLIAFGLISSANFNMSSFFSIDDLAFTGNVPIGIAEIDPGAPAANVYPNPVTTYARLAVPGRTFEHARLEVYDVNGKQVSTLDDQNGNEIIFNCAGLPAGMYFYTIVEANEVLAKGSLMVGEAQ